MARVVPVADVKSNGPEIVVVPVKVLVPVVVSSPAMVRVEPSSNVSEALERRKSVDDRPSMVPLSRHVPLYARHPVNRLSPSANVDVAPVVNSWSASMSPAASMFPAKVDVPAAVDVSRPPRLRVELSATAPVAVNAPSTVELAVAMKLVNVVSPLTPRVEENVAAPVALSVESSCVAPVTVSVPSIVDEAVESTPNPNVISESNVAASSSFTSVLSDICVCSSENESSDVEDIFSLNIFQSALVRHPNVEPLAVSHVRVFDTFERPLPVSDVKYSLFSPRIVV